MDRKGEIQNGVQDGRHIIKAPVTKWTGEIILVSLPRFLGVKETNETMRIWVINIFGNGEIQYGG